MNSIQMPDSQSFMFGEKLRSVRKSLKLKQSPFADMLEIDQPTLSKYENNHYDPHQNTISDIKFILVEKFDLNPVWWETGTGEMFSGKKDRASTQGVATVYQSQSQTMGGPRGITTYVPERLIKVPLVGINARAGFVENLENYTEYISDYAYIEPEHGVKYDNAIAISVDGDSMEPTMHRGDRVLAFFQEIAEWEYLNPGIYAVVYRNSFVIKRIMKNTLQATGQLELVSDNPIHGPITVKMEDLRAIWKVTELIRRRLY